MKPTHVHWCYNAGRYVLIAFMLAVRQSPDLAAADTLHTVQQANIRDVDSVTNDRSFGLLDSYARGEATAGRALAYIGSGTLQSVIETSFTAHGIDRTTDASAGAGIYWSVDYPFDHPELKRGLAGGAAAGAIRKINHVPGIYFLAVKQAFCDHMMTKKRAQPRRFSVAPDCYLMDLPRDVRLLQQAFDRTTKAGQTSYWMAKVQRLRRQCRVTI